MERWFQIPTALTAAVTAVFVVLVMVGGFAITYEPVQPDGSIDNVPPRVLGFFLLGAPATLLTAFVIYLVAFNLHPPTGAFSRAHCFWALGLAIAATILLAVSARDSFARWYEALYFTAIVPMLFAPLEAGFLAGSTVGAGITSRCSRRGPRGGSGNGRARVAARAAERRR